MPQRGASAPEQHQSNPATYLPSLDRVGQTDRMMTESEALKTLAREEPAVADDVRNALHSLTSGGGLGAISLLRLQEYLWYALPAGTGQPAETHLAVARALARLFTLAGMERYAEVCTNEQTSRVIKRVRRLARRGRRGVHQGADRLARGTAGHRPARLVLGHGP